MFAVELQGVAKAYRKHVAVEPLDLTVATGKVTGLLGPNGAGKTTTIRMMMGIILPDSGTVRLLGEPFRPELRRRLGYLPEERGLYPKMKVREQLEFLGGLQMDNGNLRPLVREWIARFDLDDWAERKVEELSKGMQQKIQFISAVLHDPELLILDEPFSGLDPVNAKLLKDIMMEVVDRGKTVILSTHRMEQVEMICDDICLINKGRKIAGGSLTEIKRKYGHNAVQLEFDGNDDFLAGLPGVTGVDSYGKYAELRLAEGTDPQALLAAVAGRVPVRRFEVTNPSINDIFIELVGSDRVPADEGGAR